MGYKNATKSIGTVLSDVQACLFSRLVLNYIPSTEREKNYICISANHSSANLSFREGPVFTTEGGRRLFYEPMYLRVRWFSTTHDEALLTYTKEAFTLELWGQHRDPNSYYSHLVRVRPDIDPAAAVELRIASAINKAVKNSSARKRRRQLAHLQVRKMLSSDMLMAKLEDAIRKELEYLPDDIRVKGLYHLQEQLQR